MGKRLRRLKKIRLHHEGTRTLVWGALGLIALNLLLFYIFPQGIIFYIVFILSIIVYCTVVNFYRCPIRIFDGETDGLIVAPADGHIVVIEEVEENEYFHDRRMMVSIFMSLFNVHANWIPVDGKVRMVKHQNGNFHRAWLPKASEENERSTILITATNGEDILVRQVAGAVARRIVTYAQEGEECYIDEDLGFIKLGSRVDLYLPLGTKIEVEMGQRTIGNETVIAHLAPSEEKDEEL